MVSIALEVIRQSIYSVTTAPYYNTQHPILVLQSILQALTKHG